MAAQATTLKFYRSNGDLLTSTLSGHTVTSVKQIQEKRRTPTGNQTVFEYELMVVQTALDALGVDLGSKCTFTISAKYPKGTTEAIIAACETVARDIVAGDEFANSIRTGEWNSHT